MFWLFRDAGASATLLSVAFGLGSIYIQHKATERNRKIRVAEAIKSEIEELHRIQINGIVKDRSSLIKKADAGTERFTTWGSRDAFTIYENVVPDLLLLNEDAIRSIVRYYESLSELRSMVMNMSSETFHKLPVSPNKNEKSEYVNELLAEIDGPYAETYKEVSRQLDKYIRNSKIPL